MHFLQNLFSAPLEVLMGPKRFIEDMWIESGRSRSLLLGFPAVVISLIGVAVIALAQFTKGDLEAGYVAALERVSEEREKLDIEKFRESRMKQLADGGSGESGETDDPRDSKLEELREEEGIYLKKLISMNNKEPEYRFRLAMAKLRTDPGHGISILKSLAPEDEAGYAKAHQYLANYYANARASTQVEAISNGELALVHADYCLKRDKNDNLAKAIKAQLLMNQGRLKEAYQLFTELFEEEPVFYSQLLQINEKMEREDLNQSILERALLSYNERLSRDNLSNRDWVAYWQQMVGCYRGLGDYDRAAELLEREIEQLTAGANEDDSEELLQTSRPRRVFLKKLLGSVYLSWTAQVLSSDEDNSGPDKSDKLRGLELAKEAFQLGPSNPQVLRLLTRLVADSDPDVSAAAKEVYNPYEHFAAPASVLNELGAAAMKNEDFDAAVRFFERAKKKAPNDPMILNNLSYSWLRSDEQDANRALQLVDQGLRLIAGKAQYITVRSNFLDTRGTALVQLGRYEEAIAAFEKALTSRPEDIELLKQLVECYENAGLDPSVLTKRIERLQESAGSE